MSSLSFAQTNEETLTLSPTSKKWSFQFDLHGTGADSGMGLGFETPRAKGFALRTSYAADRLNKYSFSFQVISLDIKYTPPTTSGAVEPYVLFGPAFMRGANGRDDGTATAYDVGLGIEWRTFERDNQFRSAFIELVQSSSTFGPAWSPDDTVRDGVSLRLGLRRFF